jgi:hypothetical protein
MAKDAGMSISLSPQNIMTASACLTQKLQIGMLCPLLPKETY